MLLNFHVNGAACNLECAPEKRLIDILREDLFLTGNKEGCGEGECGACTVLLDEVAVCSCLVLAGQLMHKRVVTIEGLAQSGELDRLQQAFVSAGAIQCGYCTAGMIMSAKALLLTNPQPTEEQIRSALSGNICRCSGYTQIISAVQLAAGGDIDG